RACAGNLFHQRHHPSRHPHTGDHDHAVSALPPRCARLPSLVLKRGAGGEIPDHLPPPIPATPPPVLKRGAGGEDTGLPPHHHSTGHRRTALDKELRHIETRRKLTRGEQRIIPIDSQIGDTRADRGVEGYRPYAAARLGA